MTATTAAIELAAVSSNVNHILGEMLTIGDELRTLKFKETDSSFIKSRIATFEEIRYLEKEAMDFEAQNIFFHATSKYAQLPQPSTELKSKEIFNQMSSLVAGLDDEDNKQLISNLNERYLHLESLVNQLEKEVTIRDTDSFKNANLEKLRDEEELEWERECAIKHENLNRLKNELKEIQIEETELDLILKNRTKTSNYSLKVGNLKDLIKLRLRDKLELEETINSMEGGTTQSEDSHKINKRNVISSLPLSTNSSSSFHSLQQHFQELNNSIKKQRNLIEQEKEKNQELKEQLELLENLKERKHLLQEQKDKETKSILQLKAATRTIIDYKAKKNCLLAKTLKLLQENNGEMQLNELKLKLLTGDSHVEISSSLPVQAIYSLVANRCVALDRTSAGGNVKSYLL